LRKLEKAEEYYEKAIELDPKDEVVHNKYAKLVG